MSDILQDLRHNNPALGLEDVQAPGFGVYGRLLDTYDAGEMIARARAILPQAQQVVYEPSVAALEESSSLNMRIMQQIYGGMPIQIGWCYGRNTRMGALEYHKGTEVLICLTDIVLLVGHLGDIRFGAEIRYDAAKVRAYYAPAGSVIEFFPWCLHFAPIQARTEEQFATLVYLPKGTNEPLPFPAEPVGESRLLFAVNKWLIAHPGATDLVKAGAYAGIVGADIVVRPA
ncbi:MAG: DUF4867 family protein [Chloroflexi bacterium]|nr:DUF4867 family protein [Chloroflexota bacterium]